MKNIISKDYTKFLNDIKSRIVSARIQAARSVNRELITLYWDIGKNIVERQNQFSWGKGVVEQLSRDLTKEYADFEGFSRDNLWRMRMFYLEYKDDPILAQLVPELPWGQYMNLVKGFLLSATSIVWPWVIMNILSICYFTIVCSNAL